MSLLRNNVDNSINFQKASCTLDGCVKIWTSRVDSVGTETGKLLSNLASEGKVDAEDAELDDTLAFWPALSGTEVSVLTGANIDDDGEDAVALDTTNVALEDNALTDAPSSVDVFSNVNDASDAVEERSDRVDATLDDVGGTARA